jgi:hypothetical protein
MQRKITRSKNLQPSLFDQTEPRVVLTPVQMTQIAKLVEALLREIAATLAAREVGNDQDHD